MSVENGRNIYRTYQKADLSKAPYTNGNYSSIRRELGMPPPENRPGAVTETPMKIAQEIEEVLKTPVTFSKNPYGKVIFNINSFAKRARR